MKFEYDLLDDNEKLVFALRSLYYHNGYKQYKMSKFEDYDLYSKNKDFLISDSLITFTDTNGRLKALKPDVTLSIIKNYKDAEGLRKVCYNETVYRVSKGTGSFRELMQTGIECMGNMGDTEIASVLDLAMESMAMISDKYILEISDLDLLSVFVERASSDPEVRKEILHSIAEKNQHGLMETAAKYELESAPIERLKKLITLYGAAEKVLPAMKKLVQTEKEQQLLTELEEKIGLLSVEKVKDHLILDFSLVNDMKYYNGITFQGFIEGIPDSMLSGGQYNRLMKRMGRKSGAIGFAVYLDALERFQLPDDLFGEV